MRSVKTNPVRSPISIQTRVLVVLVVALAFAAGTSPVFAQADAEAAKAAARAKLLKGSRFLDAGSYARALKEFDEAYRIFPSPKIFFNIGLANTRLERYPEALRAFDHFLAEATEVTPETVAQAKAQVELVRPKVAVIDVACAQEGVEIVVDERPVGRVPLGEPLYLAPGQHRLAARFAAGAAPFLKTFDAAGGTRERIDVPVEKPAVATSATSKAPAVVAAPAVAPSPLPVPPVAASSGPAPPPPSVGSEPQGVLVDRPSSAASSDERPLYRRPWVWAVAAGVLVSAGATLWLTVGRSQDYPDPSLGHMNFPAGGVP